MLNLHISYFVLTKFNNLFHELLSAHTFGMTLFRTILNTKIKIFSLKQRNSAINDTINVNVLHLGWAFCRHRWNRSRVNAQI